MDELLPELLRMARDENAVASRRLANGTQLLAYPVDSGALIALGYEGPSGRQIDVEQVLRRRAHDMERFGRWLPARFADDSFYLVQRLRNPDALHVDGADLPAAEELLT